METPITKASEAKQLISPKDRSIIAYEGKDLKALRITAKAVIQASMSLIENWNRGKLFFSPGNLSNSNPVTRKRRNTQISGSKLSNLTMHQSAHVYKTSARTTGKRDTREAGRCPIPPRWQERVLWLPNSP